MRITNITAADKLPIKKGLNFREIIEKSKWVWLITNEKYTPIISTKFKRNEGLTSRGKEKAIHVSIFINGTIVMSCLKSLKEGNELYDKIVKDFKRIKAL